MTCWGLIPGPEDTDPGYSTTCAKCNRLVHLHELPSGKVYCAHCQKPVPGWLALLCLAAIMLAIAFAEGWTPK